MPCLDIRTLFLFSYFVYFVNVQEEEFWDIFVGGHSVIIIETTVTFLVKPEFKPSSSYWRGTKRKVCRWWERDWLAAQRKPKSALILMSQRVSSYSLFCSSNCNLLFLFRWEKTLFHYYYIHKSTCLWFENLPSWKLCNY